MSGRRTRVKICGITRVYDAIAAAELGADAIGLVFWSGTPRKVSHAQARAIVTALPPFIGVVGLFVDPEPGEVQAALAAVPLDVLQFHGSESASFCRGFGRRYLKAIAVRDGTDLLKPLRLTTTPRAFCSTRTGWAIFRAAPATRSTRRGSPRTCARALPCG